MSEERKNAYRAAYVADADAMCRLTEDMCESEIEKLFFLALLARDDTYRNVEVPGDLRKVIGADAITANTSVSQLWCHRAGPPFGWEQPSVPVPMHHAVCHADVVFWIVPQWQLTLEGKSYRLDFALVPQDTHRCPLFAIELDGHDFHERTKEQAARDRSRDRALAKAGWQVLRFTGSELWKDPRKCARDVRDAMLWEEARRDKSALRTLRYLHEVYGLVGTA